MSVVVSVFEMLFKMNRRSFVQKKKLPERPAPDPMVPMPWPKDLAYSGDETPN